MSDPTDWMPWNLAAHAVAVAVPIVGILFAMTAYDAMVARIQISDPDNPLVRFNPWALGARRRKTDMTLFYMSTYGADANSVAYVGGYVMATVGIVLFPQIDSILLRLASTAVKMLSDLGY